MNILCVCLAAALLGAMSAVAQVPADSVPTKVYTYVEQMPELPGGGGLRAIVTAVQRNLRYPKEAQRDRIEGKVFVSFTVTETGQVQNVKVVKGIGSACDEAVVTAVQLLPRFTPGRQNGQPVPVNFTVPATFKLAAPIRVR